MRRWMRALLVALAASLSVTDTAGVADTGTISGIVLDTDGAPVAGASVKGVG